MTLRKYSGKKQKLFSLTAFFLSMLFTASVYAQPMGKAGGGYAVSQQLNQAGYTTEIYDARNGLPTSDANFVTCTSDGYIWICGYSGVIRYDGSSFERLPTLFGLTSGRCMFEDSKKRLWVGTNDNGVVVLENESSRHYTYKDGLPSSSIRIFAEDKKGNIFIGTTAGVCYVDSFGKLNQISDERLNSERILKMDSDTSGRIYGQTKTGIVFAIDNCKVTEVYTSRELGTESITSLLCDPRRPGKVYLCTEASTIYYGDFGNKRDSLARIDVAPLKNIHWISYDCERLWISSTSMLGYLDHNNKFCELKNLPMNSSIEMTTSDYQGNIWMASATQGIMKIATNNFVDLTQKASLPKSTTNTTCLHKGKLYIGTDKGLQILDENRHPLENSLTDYIGGARIRCIVTDSKDNIWLASYTNDLGLICFSPDGKISSFTKEKGMPDNHVRCIYVTEDQKILCGTNGGLAVIKDGKVIKSIGKDDGIHNTEFLTVCEGDNGDILCGSDGDGIYVISDAENAAFVKHLGRDDGLTSDVVMRIKKDRMRDMYWIVTSNSLQYIKDGAITCVKTFPYNNNYDLYFNSTSEFWILSSYGIYTVNADSLISDLIKDYRLYTIANGLPYSITSNSYSCLDEDGNLYISGREGVILVNINHFFDHNSNLKVDITSVFCDEQKIFKNPDGSYTLPPSNGRIKITPSVMDYSMENPFVRFFLEGNDDYGITVRRNNLSPLEYTGLPYGSYKFHIQILDNNRSSVLMDRSFSITKKPRLAELFIFKFLSGALLVLLAGFIVWRVMKSTVVSRQYEQIRIAKEEAERASSTKSRFLSNMSQQILTPISTIMSMDEMIIREKAIGVPKSYFISVLNYAIDIRSASESLYSLINDLLEMTKIESGKLQLVQQEYDVNNFLQPIISQIRSLSSQKQLIFDVHIDEMLPKRLYGDMGKIKQVVLKLLTNAVKFTDEGSVTLKVSMENRTDDLCGLCISVRDTGTGIKEEDVETLFSTYENIDKTFAPEKVKTGLGLDISRKFAELMGGVLVCQGNYGKGAEFIFTLEQKIIDPSPLGIFKEVTTSASLAPYIPLFVAPDADILVVDDNPLILNAFRFLLKSTGVFITTAMNYEDCIENIRSNTFNIVFISQNTPGLEGEETIEKIRKIAPELPVYALTENTTEGEDFYINKGYNGFISIPLDSELLERLILRHLPEQIVERPDKNYAIDNLNELPENLKWLYQVKEIDISEGIKNAGSIGSFVFAIKTFYEIIDDNIRSLESIYKNGDLKLFAAKMRMIKTSSKIIGAGDLLSKAAKMEEACKREDLIFLGTNIDSFLKSYQAYKEILK